MKIAWFIVLTVCINTPSRGQENDIDTTITNLKGSVKKMEVITYKTNNKGSEIINDYYDSTYYYFNENGFLLKKEESKYDGTPKCNFIYHYNEQGYLTHIYSKCCKQRKKWEYVFNDKGLIISEKYENNISFHLNQENDSICYIAQQSNYLYNENDVLIQKNTSFFSCETLLKKKTINYVYQNNELTNYKVYSECFFDCELTETDSTLVKVEEASKNDLDFEFRHTKFDVHGNWIEEMIFLDNVPIAKTYRNIKYNK